jgi:ribosomal protein S18 acetylase RimI-like enzyme
MTPAPDRHHGRIWRDAEPTDDDAVIALCLALNREDPGLVPVAEDQVRRTLTELRGNPWRGKASVLEIGGLAQGYALLIAFWSNELGGEVCVIDEIYVALDFRGLGYASTLLEDIPRAFGRTIVAAALEVSAANERAHAFYRRLGFAGSNTALARTYAALESGEARP